MMCSFVLTYRVEPPGKDGLFAKYEPFGPLRMGGAAAGHDEALQTQLAPTVIKHET